MLLRICLLYTSFEWDDGNNYRMRDFIQTLGFELLAPNGAQMNEALALSEDMEAVSYTHLVF